MKRLTPRIFAFGALALSLAVVPARAQNPVATRLSILQAEDLRAPTAQDLAVIRSGAHNADPQTARIAIRALGRLERPALISEITLALRNPATEVRAEAATAMGQAAQGWKRDRTAGGAQTTPESTIAALGARLKVEAEPDVRAAICETLGRIPRWQRNGKGEEGCSGEEGRDGEEGRPRQEGGAGQEGGGEGRAGDLPQRRRGENVEAGNAALRLPQQRALHHLP
jgi:hypothetical protein